MPVQAWEIMGTDILHETAVFTLRREVCRHPSTGLVHPFYTLTVDDWVNVLPLTDDGHAVLIRQWRQGVRGFTLEVPGGMAMKGEAPAAAAARELREETGYGFRALLPLGSVTANPAIQNNRCHLFVAVGARQEGPATPEETEEMDVLAVPLDEALAMVDDGRIDHTMVVNTFLRLRASHGGEAGEILGSLARWRA